MLFTCLANTNNKYYIVYHSTCFQWFTNVSKNAVLYINKQLKKKFRPDFLYSLVYDNFCQRSKVNDRNKNKNKNKMSQNKDMYNMK